MVPEPLRVELLVTPLSSGLYSSSVPDPPVDRKLTVKEMVFAADAVEVISIMI